MAKRFKFRLESLLKIRSHKVDMAKESLDEVLHIRYQKEDQIEKTRDYKTLLLKKASLSKPAFQHQADVYHRQSVEFQIQKLIDEKERLIEIENIRRQQLAKAMQEEKILSKLKEKKQLAHDEEVKLEETNFLDEIAISRYERRDRSSGLSEN